MKIDTSELDRSLERLKEIRKDFKKRLDKYSEKSPVSTEAILELLNDNMSDLNDTDCEEYFDELESDAKRLDHLIAISNQCKLFATDNERRAQEYRQSADLWERRLQKLQGYGIRLLNKQPMKSLENDDYIAGLDRNIFEVKCGLTRKYSTENMIPDELIFSIPEAYRQPKIIWEMRADLVRDTLISGKKLNFAKLIDKQRLRIINKSEENYEP
jgi:hypothetical protein